MIKGAACDVPSAVGFRPSGALRGELLQCAGQRKPARRGLFPADGNCRGFCGHGGHPEDRLSRAGKAYGSASRCWRCQLCAADSGGDSGNGRMLNGSRRWLRLGPVELSAVGTCEVRVDTVSGARAEHEKSRFGPVFHGTRADVCHSGRDVFADPSAAQPVHGGQHTDRLGGHGDDRGRAVAPFGGDRRGGAGAGDVLCAVGGLPAGAG